MSFLENVDEVKKGIFEPSGPYSKATFVFYTEWAAPGLWYVQESLYNGLSLRNETLQKFKFENLCLFLLIFLGGSLTIGKTKRDEK